MIGRLLIPYLMGQRRTGLLRVRDIDTHVWNSIDVPGFVESEIDDSDEQMRRMGEIYVRLSGAVAELASAGAVPLTISGDCVSTLGVLAGLQRANMPPDRILWLDAHGDFHTWETTLTNYIGGMPLAMLVGRGGQRRSGRDAGVRLWSEIGTTPYPEEQIILSDARDLDPGEREAIEDSDIRTCSIEKIFRHLSRDQTLYLHWDTDVIDAEGAMPALKYHVKHGPSYLEIRDLFQLLRGINIVAISVSAWHEEKDLDNRTARACLRLLEELT
jgi:arginase